MSTTLITTNSYSVYWTLYCCFSPFHGRTFLFVAICTVALFRHRKRCTLHYNNTAKIAKLSPIGKRARAWYANRALECEKRTQPVVSRLQRAYSTCVSLERRRGKTCRCAFKTSRKRCHSEAYTKERTRTARESENGALAAALVRSLSERARAGEKEKEHKRTNERTNERAARTTQKETLRTVRSC